MRYHHEFCNCIKLCSEKQKLTLKGDLLYIGASVNGFPRSRPKSESCFGAQFYLKFNQDLHREKSVKHDYISLPNKLLCERKCQFSHLVFLTIKKIFFVAKICCSQVLSHLEPCIEKSSQALYYRKTPLLSLDPD